MITKELKAEITKIGVAVTNAITKDLGAVGAGHSFNLPMSRDAIIQMFHGYFDGEELPVGEITYHECAAPEWVKKMWPPKKKTITVEFEVFYPNFNPASVPYTVKERTRCLDDMFDDED